MTIVEYGQKWLGFIGLGVALFGICLAAKDLHLIIANFIKRMGGLGEAVFVRQARKIRRRYATQEKHAATGGRITRWIANSSIRLERYYSKNLQRQVDNFLLGNGFPSGKITLEDGIASEVQVRQVMSRFGPSVDKFARSGEPIDFSTKALFWVIVGQILQLLAALPLSLPKF